MQFGVGFLVFVYADQEGLQLLHIQTTHAILVPALCASEAHAQHKGLQD